MTIDNVPPQAHRLTSYPPRTQGNGKKGIDGRELHGIIIPTGLGNAAHDGGETSVAEGGRYVWQALQALLRREGAIVTDEEVPVAQIAADVQREKTERQPTVRNAPEVVAVAQETARRVYDTMMIGRVPLLMEGDHSAVLGLAGALKMYVDPENPEFSTLKVVFFDAHADILQEPDPVTGGNAYGRTLSTLLGEGPADLMPLMEGVPKLRPENLLYVGTHLPDEEEVLFIADKKIPCLDLDFLRDHPAEANAQIDEFLTIEKEGQRVAAPFHCELDVDVLAESESKGNPMPNEEGLTRGELYKLVRRMQRKGKLVSLGIAEVAEALDRENDQQTLKIAVGFAARLLGMGDPNYYGEGYAPHMGATTA